MFFVLFQNVSNLNANDPISEEIAHWEKNNIDVDKLTSRLQNAEKENDSLRDKVLLLERKVQVKFRGILTLHFRNSILSFADFAGGKRHPHLTGEVPEGEVQRVAGRGTLSEVRQVLPIEFHASPEETRQVESATF